VFARFVENKYLENIITYNNDRFEYTGIRVFSDIEKHIRKLSSLLEPGNVVEKSKCMLHLFKNVHITPITNIELDVIERTFIDIFIKHLQEFTLLVNNIDTIDDLSSVLFNSVTLKICFKLSPLLAIKFMHNFNTDSSICRFFKDIYAKAENQINFGTNSRLGLNRTKYFLLQHKKKFTVGFLGITLGTLINHKYFSNTPTPTIKEERSIIIYPSSSFRGCYASNYS